MSSAPASAHFASRQLHLHISTAQRRSTQFSSTPAQLNSSSAQYQLIVASYRIAPAGTLRLDGVPQDGRPIRQSSPRATLLRAPTTNEFLKLTQKRSEFRELVTQERGQPPGPPCTRRRIVTATEVAGSCRSLHQTVIPRSRGRSRMPRTPFHSCNLPNCSLPRLFLHLFAGAR
jgi:hypothetical protein